MKIKMDKKAKVKMAVISLYQGINLNVNGFNSLIKRDRVPEWVKKKKKWGPIDYRGTPIPYCQSIKTEN